MHLVQLLLPLYDNSGQQITSDHFDRVRRLLTDRFGGVTTYSRAPAEGLWKDSGDSTARDDIVVYEVMVEALDREWWSQFREELRVTFRQQELIVRVLPCETL